MFFVLQRCVEYSERTQIMRTLRIHYTIWTNKRDERDCRLGAVEHKEERLNTRLTENSRENSSLFVQYYFERAIFVENQRSTVIFWCRFLLFATVDFLMFFFHHFYVKIIARHAKCTNNCHLSLKSHVFNCLVPPRRNEICKCIVMDIKWRWTEFGWNGWERKEYFVHFNSI